MSIYLTEESRILDVNFVARQERRRQHRIRRRRVVQVTIAVCLDLLQLLLLLFGQERVEPIGNVLIDVHLTVQLRLRLLLTVLLRLRLLRLLLLLLQRLLSKRFHGV